MNQCHKCPHRAELHPEYKTRTWESLPCIDCDGEIALIDNAVPFNEERDSMVAEVMSRSNSTVRVWALLRICVLAKRITVGQIAQELRICRRTVERKLAESIKQNAQP